MRRASCSRMVSMFTPLAGHQTTIHSSGEETGQPMAYYFACQCGVCGWLHDTPEVAKDEGRKYIGGLTRAWLKVKEKGWTGPAERWRRPLFAKS